MARRIRMARTDDLPARLLGALKQLAEEAFGEPLVEDWDHAIGGVHFFVTEDGEPVSHASLVERGLNVGGRLLRTGYVEAVATLPAHQHRGLASHVIRALSDYAGTEYELGALCTGLNAFYERLGWETWRGPTFVRTKRGLNRTEEEDGNIMILRTASTPDLDLAAPISCEWRSGDVW